LKKCQPLALFFTIPIDLLEPKISMFCDNPGYEVEERSVYFKPESSRSPSLPFQKFLTYQPKGAMANVQALFGFPSKR